MTLFPNGHIVPCFVCVGEFLFCGVEGSRKRRSARRGSRTAATGGSSSTGSFDGNTGQVPSSESRYAFS